MLQNKINLTIGAQIFRGEDTAGVWSLEILAKHVKFDEISMSATIHGHGTEPDTFIVNHNANFFQHFFLNANLLYINTILFDCDVLIDLARNIFHVCEQPLFIAKHALCHIISGKGDDTIVGDEQDNQILAGSGFNLITTGVGRDLLIFFEDDFSHNYLTDFSTIDDQILIKQHQKENEILVKKCDNYCISIGNVLIEFLSPAVVEDILIELIEV